jgi:hypothetical protein
VTEQPDPDPDDQEAHRLLTEQASSSEHTVYVPDPT